MGLRARKIHALSLLLALAALLCAGTDLFAQDISSGSYTVLKRYIFPRFNGDNELQYLVYGATAVNKGSLIYLTTPMIDIVDGSYTSIRQIDTINARDPYPVPYKLGSEGKVLQRFWSSSHHRHSQAWIFAEKATFDKTTNILTSDENAYFRSRQLDADVALQAQRRVRAGREHRRGGDAHALVREAIEILLKGQGKWDSVLEKYML